MTLSHTALRELPLHDARFLSLSVVPTVSSLAVRFTIEINPEEDITVLHRYGIRQRQVQFVFSECWTAYCELLGTTSSPETVDDWIVDLDSTLIRDLRVKGFANNTTVSEHYITMSGGSRIRIIAETVDFVEPP
jgi:hypothetical protein